MAWCTLTVAGIIVAGAVITGIAVSGGGGVGAGQSADQGTIAPHCYSTVSDQSGSSVTVAVLGTSDCASVVQFLDDQFPGFTVTPAASMGPGNAVCQGMLGGGAYPASVIDPSGNAEDVECTYLGFSPAP